MESSSRMRRCLKRNYRGCDHSGAAANYEDHTETKESIINPSNAPALAAEAISLDAVNEDDEQTEAETLERAYGMEQDAENQQRISGAAEQTTQTSVESGDNLHNSDQDLLHSPSEVAPGYVPSELDERIILEVPSSMVRPLRVVRGTFQVSFITVDKSCFNCNSFILPKNKMEKVEITS